MAITILIADDEANLVRLLVRICEREGYRVLTASNGQEAIDRIAECPGEIHAVVLDVVIPPDGPGPILDAALAARPDVGIVMVSGALPPPELAARLDAEEGIFLQKPFRPATLIELLERLVSPSGQPGA
jgi:two-component system cell cycle sensor histidine kinase/response regulator CckA